MNAIKRKICAVSGTAPAAHSPAVSGDPIRPWHCIGVNEVPTEEQLGCWYSDMIDSGQQPVVVKHTSYGLNGIPDDPSTHHVSYQIEVCGRDFDPHKDLTRWSFMRCFKEEVGPFLVKHRNNSIDSITGKPFRMCDVNQYLGIEDPFQRHRD